MRCESDGIFFAISEDDAGTALAAEILNDSVKLTAHGCIEACGRLVEYKKSVIGTKRPCEQYTLSLSAR